MSHDNRDAVECLAYLLHNRIEHASSQPPIGDSTTEILRLHDVQSVCTSYDALKVVLIDRLFNEMDEIKYLLFAIKRAELYSNNNNNNNNKLITAFKDIIIELLLSQLLQWVTDENNNTTDLWSMDTSGPEATSYYSTAHSDNRSFTLLRHLTSQSRDTAPLPEYLLTRVIDQLYATELGQECIMKLVRSGGYNILSVDSLEHVSSKHMEAFPPLELLLAQPNCINAIANTLHREISICEKEGGSYFNTNSILTELLSYSLLRPAHVKYLSTPIYQSLTNIPGFPTQFVDMINNSNSLRVQNSEYTHKVCKLSHSILKKLLRNATATLRFIPLAWVGRVLDMNHLYATPKLIKDKPVTNLGWLINLVHVCLLFCEPFFTRQHNQQLIKICPDYASSLSAKTSYINEACFAHGLISVQTTTDKQETSYNFMTEIFFLTQRALNLTIIPHLPYNISIVSDLIKAAERKDKDSPERKRLESLAGILFITWDMTVLNDQFTLLVSQFYVTYAIWLRMQIEQHNTDNNAMRQLLREIPEFAFRDMCLWFKYLVSTYPIAFRHLEMAPVIDLCVLLLQRPDLLPGPVAQSKIVSLILSMVQPSATSTMATSWSTVHGELSAIIHSNPYVQHRLGPALLQAYTAMDVVEGLDVDRDAFDKYTARFDITKLIQLIWGRHDCKDSILSASKPDTFLPFIDSTLDTLLYMLSDCIHRIRNAKRIQASIDDTSTWGKLTEREQRGKLDFLASEKHVTKGFLHITYSTLLLLELITDNGDIAKLFCSQPIANRIATTLIGFFEDLCGSRAKELNVKDKESFNFSPKGLLKSLSKILYSIQAQDSEGVLHTALLNNPDTDINSLHKMIRVISNEGVYWAKDSAEYINKLGSAHAEVLQTSAKEADTTDNSSEECSENLDVDSLLEVYTVSLGESNYSNCDLSSCHALIASAAAQTSPTKQKIKALMREVTQLQQSLPLHPDSSILIRQDENRMDLVRALITGPSETPYAYGCFIFDFLFPDNYPAIPPLVKLVTTGGGTVRFNPNLYADGKVCLSLLGTWHGGSANEKWSPEVSSLYQVLVSIQSIILIADPMYNEPGYESIRGTSEGNERSNDYSTNIAIHTIRHAMTDVIRHPPHGFEDVVQIHFSLLKQSILVQCEKWINNTSNPQQKERLVKSVKELKKELFRL